MGLTRRFSEADSDFNNSNFAYQDVSFYRNSWYAPKFVVSVRPAWVDFGRWIAAVLRFKSEVTQFF